jgi:hypothetical protein
MSNVFQELLVKIENGECISGKFVRRAVDNGQAVAFDELVVETNGGGHYATDDPMLNKEFFDKVDYSGCGTNSGYCSSEHCNRYETIGYWRACVTSK